MYRAITSNCFGVKDIPTVSASITGFWDAVDVFGFAGKDFKDSSTAVLILSDMSSD